MQKQHNRVPPQTFQRLNDLAIFVTSKVKRGTKGFGRQRIPGGTAVSQPSVKLQCCQKPVAYVTGGQVHGNMVAM